MNTDENYTTAAQLTTARWYLMNTPMAWSEEVTEALLDTINDRLGYAPPSAPDSPICALPALEQRANIALCLGHARPVDEGNVSVGGMSEEAYNETLIVRVQQLLKQAGVRSCIIDEYPRDGYTAAMEWLAEELVIRDCTAAVEFHFNAYNGRANGHEVLHWSNSLRGVKLAKSINESLTQTFPDQTDRGLKPRVYTDRGALFLSLTHCPAAILEPFFGDNPREWERFSDPDTIELLANAYARGIIQWVATMEEGLS